MADDDTRAWIRPHALFRATYKMNSTLLTAGDLLATVLGETDPDRLMPVQRHHDNPDDSNRSTARAALEEAIAASIWWTPSEMLAWCVSACPSSFFP